jgi:hypothetical protein
MVAQIDDNGAVPSDSDYGRCVDMRRSIPKLDHLKLMPEKTSNYFKMLLYNAAKSAAQRSSKVRIYQIK